MKIIWRRSVKLKENYVGLFKSLNKELIQIKNFNKVYK